MRAKAKAAEVEQGELRTLCDNVVKLRRRGEQVRQARSDGLAQARTDRIAYHRNTDKKTRP